MTGKDDVEKINEVNRAVAEQAEISRKAAGDVTKTTAEISDTVRGWMKPKQSWWRRMLRLKE
jgi:hypothetical protein